jgi:hypothetical protein
MGSEAGHRGLEEYVWKELKFVTIKRERRLKWLTG